MYNVALNKTLFQTGRDFVSAVSGSPELSKLPEGLTELLTSFTSQAQSSWSEYQDGRANNYQHDRIFGLAVRAITAVTLGLEVVVSQYWVVRMEYYQDQKGLMTPAHSAFAQAAGELLKLAYNVAVELNKNVPPQAVCDAAEGLKRLQYALHIAQVGLSVCKPKGYGQDSWNPATSWWLSLCARTLRNQSSMQIHTARFFEEQERDLISAQN